MNPARAGAQQAIHQEVREVRRSRRQEAQEVDLFADSAPPAKNTTRRRAEQQQIEMAGASPCFGREFAPLP